MSKLVLWRSKCHPYLLQTSRGVVVVKVNRNNRTWNLPLVVANADMPYFCEKKLDAKGEDCVWTVSVRAVKVAFYLEIKRKTCDEGLSGG